jgi:tetratricopeptide (TPR) repeat protein
VTGWILLALFVWQGESEKAAAELHDRGLRLYEQGEAEAGIRALRESFEMHRKLGKRMEQAVNLRVLAYVHEGIGERQKALGLYEQALGVLRAGGWKELEARTLRDIGVLYYNLDENAKAFGYLERSLAMQRGTAKPGVLATTLFSLGELRRYQGEKAKARALFDEAVALAREAGDRKTEADARSSRAMLEGETGREELEAALAIRLETKDRRGEASTRAKLGVKLAGMGKVEEARGELRRSIALFGEERYRGGEAFARQALAMLERKAGNLEAAASEMLAAVTLAEGLRQRLSDRDLRATYIGYVQNRYEFLIETYLALDKGDGRRAFAMSERARARAIVEALSDAGVKGGAEAATLTAEQVRREVLDGETTLVEYALGTERSHLFVVTKAGGVRHRELPGRAVLEAMARRAYAGYREAGKARPDAAELARVLLPGVTGKKLLVVADGALQYLPFADLTEATVALAPSASALAAMGDGGKRSGGKRLAVFADPAAPRLARLAFARMEAESILRLAPAGERVAAMGAEATREAVLKNPAAVMHFAAHSVLDTDRPEQTEIVLAGGSLRLRDIYGMKLGAELVVLSACQTALGKEMKREGLMSLTRAFQQAGVRRVVASLWKVDDRATAELMRHFYAEMWEGKKTAAEALRAAQRRVAGTKRWAHPFYWAGFVLQGEYR